MHLRPRTNTIGAVARIRNALSWATHDFFQSHGFLYLHTPLITTSDCEGAGEMFQVPAPRSCGAPSWSPAGSCCGMLWHGCADAHHSGSCCLWGCLGVKAHTSLRMLAYRTSVDQRIWQMGPAHRQGFERPVWSFIGRCVTMSLVTLARHLKIAVQSALQRLCRNETDATAKPCLR